MVAYSHEFMKRQENAQDGSLNCTLMKWDDKVYTLTEWDFVKIYLKKKKQHYTLCRLIWANSIVLVIDYGSSYQIWHAPIWPTK